MTPGVEGRLRASHADREQVIGTLQAAFVQGMLAKNELDARLGQAFAARTHTDLAALTADLLLGLAAARQLEPVRAQGAVRAFRPGRVIMVATVLYAGVWPVAFLLPRSGPDHDPYVGLPVLATFVYCLVLLGVVARLLTDWLDNGSCGQSPRRPGVGGRGIPAPAIGRFGQVAPSARSRSPARR